MTINVAEEIFNTQLHLKTSDVEVVFSPAGLRAYRATMEAGRLVTHNCCDRVAGGPFRVESKQLENFKVVAR